MIGAGLPTPPKRPTAGLLFDHQIKTIGRTMRGRTIKNLKISPSFCPSIQPTPVQRVIPGRCCHPTQTSFYITTSHKVSPSSSLSIDPCLQCSPCPIPLSTKKHSRRRNRHRLCFNFYRELSCDERRLAKSVISSVNRHRHRISRRHHRVSHHRRRHRDLREDVLR